MKQKHCCNRGFPSGSVGKESTCNAGDTGDAGLIPVLGRSPGGEHGNLLQYFCLENPMDRGAWWATVNGVAKSQTQLSMHTHTFSFVTNSIKIKNGQHQKNFVLKIQTD